MTRVASGGRGVAELVSDNNCWFRGVAEFVSEKLVASGAAPGVGV